MSIESLPSAIASAAHHTSFRGLFTAVAAVFIGSPSAELLGIYADEARLECLARRGEVGLRSGRTDSATASFAE